MLKIMFEWYFLCKSIGIPYQLLELRGLSFAIILFTHCYRSFSVQQWKNSFCNSYRFLLHGSKQITFTDSISKTHSKLVRFHHSINSTHWVGELTKPKLPSSSTELLAEQKKPSGARGIITSGRSRDLRGCFQSSDWFLKPRKKLTTRERARTSPKRLTPQ